MVQTVERFVLSVVKEKDHSTFIHKSKEDRVQPFRETNTNIISQNTKLHNLTPKSSDKLLHGLLSFTLIVMLALRSFLSLVIKRKLLSWTSKAQHLLGWLWKS